MKVTVTLDKNAVKQRINNAAILAREAGALSLRRYANEYVRYDTGNAMKSSLVNSDTRNGLIVWISDYIRKIYYMGKPKKDKNPKASLRWAHKAAKLHKQEIQRDMQKVFNKNL